MNKTKQTLAALTIATALMSPVFASGIITITPITTVHAATQQQTSDFTPHMPQSGFQLNKNQKVKIPVMITNNTNKTRIYRLSPVNVITNDSLTTQYAKDKPGNSTYLSDLITDKTVKVAPHKTGRIFFDVTAPKQNNLIYGGLLIQADNKPEQGQTIPFDIQVGSIPKLQMTATAANFVRNTQFPALKVSYQSNGVIMQNTKIDSKLLLNNKVIAETKTDKRDIAPNSTANLSLLIKQKLEPGNYNIETTFDNGKNKQTINTPMKLNTKQLKPANAMIVDHAKAQQKSNPLKGVLIAIIAIILSAVVGAGGTILYYKKIKHPDLQSGDGTKPDDSELKPDSDFPDPVYPDKAPKKKSHFKLFHKKHKEEIPDSFNQGQEPENPLIDPNDDKKNNAINADLTFKPHYQKVPDVKSEQKHEDSIIVSDSKSENKNSAVNQVNKNGNSSSIQLGMDDDNKGKDNTPEHKSDLGMQGDNSGSENKSENSISDGKAKSDSKSELGLDNKRTLKDLEDMLK